MKTIFRSVFLCFVLFFLACSGEETTTDTPDQVKATLIEGEKPQFVGKVVSIVSNSPLEGVNIISPSSPGETTDVDGKFTLPLSNTDSLLITFAKSGYHPLQQKYINLKYLEEVVIYLEDTTTVSAKSKSLAGRTLRLLAPGVLDPIDSIRIIDMNDKDSIFTDFNGLYSFDLTKGQSILKYEFKDSATFENIYSMSIKALTDIKDSSKLDVVFNGSISGIDVELEPDSIR